jgi:hypothetical protein
MVFYHIAVNVLAKANRLHSITFRYFDMISGLSETIFKENEDNGIENDCKIEDRLLKEISLVSSSSLFVQL